MCRDRRLQIVNSVNNQATAVSLQLTDFFLTWQGGQSPSTRKTPVSALAPYYLPTSGGTLSGKLTISAGGSSITGNTNVDGDLNVTGAVSVAAGRPGFIPIGSGMDFWGALAPTGYLFAYGQAVSRTTYAALFAILGTTYGTGDGSTTFNMPDKRGRTSIGKDDMGGVAAARVTAAISGVNGTALGASGGDQRSQQHTHAITDAGHSHGVTDPGHLHSFINGNGGVPTSGDIGVIESNSNTSTGFTQSATTGVSVNSATTGVTAQNAGAGAAQNMPPGVVCNYIIFAGV